jgi:hypothetical protein
LLEPLLLPPQPTTMSACMAATRSCRRGAHVGTASARHRRRRERTPRPVDPTLLCSLSYSRRGEVLLTCRSWLRPPNDLLKARSRLSKEA